MRSVVYVNLVYVNLMDFFHTYLQVECDQWFECSNSAISLQRRVILHP